MTPGETGLSPHQILLGREPLLPGIPLPPITECEDANEFMNRIKELDAQVAKILNDLHAKEFAAINKKRKVPESFQIGQKVWVLRPRGLSADKLRSWWIGPCPVTGRLGDMSYEVEIKPGSKVTLHRSQLKPHFVDEFSAEKLQEFHFQPTQEEIDTGPDEWVVEKIMGHRKDKRGRYEFLTKWVDYDETTWEPLMNFIHRYSLDWRNYVADKKLKFDLVDYMLNNDRHGVHAVTYTLNRRFPNDHYFS
jgi:Chromo (CHRromatin Organisation MOdifier) domain